MENVETKSGRSRDFMESMLFGKVSEICIQLGKVYPFDVSDGSAVLSNIAVVPDVSYLSPALIQSHNMTNTVALTKRQSIDLPPGITIIMGKSGSGKTKLAMAHMTAMNDSVAYIRYGEPLDKRFVEALLKSDASGKEGSGMYLLPFEVNVASAIANFLLDEETDVLIVDSLRSLFYGSGGSTGKGGVNMSLFANISFLDVVVSQRGKSLVLVINPLTDDQSAYDFFIEVAKGSVSALIDVRSPTSIRYTSRYSDRDVVSIQLPDSVEVDQKQQVLSAPSAVKANLGSYSR